MKKTILIILSLFIFSILGCNVTVAPNTDSQEQSEKPEQVPEGTPSDKPQTPPLDPESNLVLTSNVPEYSFLAPDHGITLTLSQKKETPKDQVIEFTNTQWTNSNDRAVAVKSSNNTSITIEGKAIGISTITAKDMNTGHSVSYTAEVRNAEIIIIDKETRYDIPDLIQLEKNTSSNIYQYKTRILYWDSNDNIIKQFVRDDIPCTVGGHYSDFFDISNYDNIEDNVKNHYIQIKAKEDKNTFEHNNNKSIPIFINTNNLGNGFTGVSKTINLESYGDRENTDFSVSEIKINGQIVQGNNITLPDNKNAELEIIITKKNSLTLYDFDSNSILTPTGADKNGVNIEYSGSKIVSGHQVKGRPYYNHSGTDWIQKVSKDTTSTKDTWKFNISPNNTSRNREVKLPFHGGTNNFKISIYQPRSYNQHENVLWFAGVTPPTDDDFVSENVEKKYYVKEKSGSFSADGINSNFTGWFNVNKIMGNAGMSGEDLKIYSDKSMCWAMASSNLIHWWANQNKDNLKKLIDLKNDNPGKELGLYNFTYNYDSTVSKNEIDWQKQRKDKSAVGNTVRKVFIDSPTGGDPVIIFNWFFEFNDFVDKGFFEKDFKDSKYTKGIGLLSEIPEFNGSSANGIKRHIYHVEGANNREYTNKFFDDVITNGKAAMYLYQSSNSTSNKHYVTAWAVIYDDYGDVIGIYTADNNMPGLAYFDGSPSNSYLIKNRIAYKDDKGLPLIISAATNFNKKTIDSCKNTFNLLYSISSGKEEIAKFLSQQKTD